jgi:transposase InsO family protein
MLNEFCKVTRYHCKYALRLLNGPRPATRPRTRRRRPTYPEAVTRALAFVWKAAGYPWSVRLKALLPLWLPRAQEHLRLSPEVVRQVSRISPRQMDRRLRGHKRQMKKRLYGRTKPGTLLKHHIPLRTDRWDVTAPGWAEVDLVAHSGDCAAGEFVHSLNVTDIDSTWVESRAVMGKAQVRVRRAVEDIRQSLPFDLKGIDSDNGSEFINKDLYEYCQERRIQFTRGRPYKKDDNAHIEQKNWTHVRKLLGYVRYDTPAAQAAIQTLYRGDLRLFANVFLPSVKLLRKERVGGRVRRRYDAPQTPLDRVLACAEISEAVAAQLRRQRARLDPFALARSIEQQLERIYALANPHHSPAPAPPDAPPTPAPPVRRRVRKRLSIHPSPTLGRPARPVTSKTAR